MVENLDAKYMKNQDDGLEFLEKEWMVMKILQPQVPSSIRFLEISPCFSLMEPVWRREK